MTRLANNRRILELANRKGDLRLDAVQDAPVRPDRGRGAGLPVVVPGVGGDHDVGHVVIAGSARFDHRDVGRVDRDVTVGVVALELHQVHRVACLALLASPRPGRLSPSSSSACALDVGGDESCAAPGPRRERKSLLEIARVRAELGTSRSAVRTDSTLCALAGSAEPPPVGRLSPREAILKLPF